MVQDLFQQQTVFSKVEDPDREILSVKYLTEDVLRGFENEIYVISEKAFRKRKFYIDVPNLLIAGAGEEPAPAVGSSDLLVLEHLSTEDCVNKVSEMLEKDRPFSTAESFLRSVRQQSYANKYDFNEIIEIIYELLKNPFSIANVNGGIINYKNIYNVNEYLSGILKRGEEIGVSDTTREISRQVSQSPGPVMFETIMGEPLRHIINKIVFQGKVVAYLFVAQIQSPLSEKDYPLIEMICQWISDEFAKNKDLLDSRRYLADHLLTDLLENDYGTSQEVHSRIEILKFGQKPYHYIVAADLRFIRDKKLRIENLKEALKQILKSSRDITYKENLVYYLNSDQNHYFDSEKMAALIDFCSAATARDSI